MTWGRLDDKLHDHRKAYKAGTAAMGLWVMANSWCCDNWKTDGFIPTRILNRFGDSEYDVEDYADRLVRAGLWFKCEVDDEPGYRFHDWEHMRPTSEKDALGGTWGNHNRWHVQRDITKEGCEHCFPPDDDVYAGHPGMVAGESQDGEKGHPGGANRTAEPDITIGDSAPNHPAMSRDDQHKHHEKDVAGIAPRIAPVAVAVPDPVAERTYTRASGLPAVFEKFIDAYPGDVATKPALAAWAEAVKRAKGKPQLIIDGAIRYAEHFRLSGKEPRFIRNAVKWLNEDGWLDELKTPPRASPPTRASEHMQLANRLAAQEQQRSSGPKEIAQ